MEYKHKNISIELDRVIPIGSHTQPLTIKSFGHQLKLKTNIEDSNEEIETTFFYSDGQLKSTAFISPRLSTKYYAEDILLMIRDIFPNLTNADIHKSGLLWATPSQFLQVKLAISPSQQSDSDLGIIFSEDSGDDERYPESHFRLFDVANISKDLSRNIQDQAPFQIS
ncbi:MAG: hypothetical protein AAFY36_14475 [Bacteroidota bacterium]